MWEVFMISITDIDEILDVSLYYRINIFHKWNYVSWGGGDLVFIKKKKKREEKLALDIVWGYNIEWECACLPLLV